MADPTRGDESSRGRRERETLRAQVRPLQTHARARCDCRPVVSLPGSPSRDHHGELEGTLGRHSETETIAHCVVYCTVYVYNGLNSDMQPAVAVGRAKRVLCVGCVGCGVAVGGGVG